MRFPEATLRGLPEDELANSRPVCLWLIYLEKTRCFDPVIRVNKVEDSIGANSIRGNAGPVGQRCARLNLEGLSIRPGENQVQYLVCIVFNREGVCGIYPHV